LKKAPKGGGPSSGGGFDLIGPGQRLLTECKVLRPRAVWGEKISFSGVRRESTNWVEKKSKKGQRGEARPILTVQVSLRKSGAQGGGGGGEMTVWS